jgi:hypothetical protein
VVGFLDFNKATIILMIVLEEKSPAGTLFCFPAVVDDDFVFAFA